MRWDAHEGALRLHAGGQYEQRFLLGITRDGSPATQGTYVYRGTSRDDGIVPGQLVFSPVDGRRTFTGRLSPDSTLTIAQRLDAGSAETTLVYMTLRR